VGGVNDRGAKVILDWEVLGKDGGAESGEVLTRVEVLSGGVVVDEVRNRREESFTRNII